MGNKGAGITLGIREQMFFLSGTTNALGPNAGRQSSSGSCWTAAAGCERIAENGTRVTLTLPARPPAPSGCGSSDIPEVPDLPA